MLHNHGEGPIYRASSWLKAATIAFTFKTLLGHYAKQALTPWYVQIDVKLVANAKVIRGLMIIASAQF